MHVTMSQLYWPNQTMLNKSGLTKGGKRGGLGRRLEGEVCLALRPQGDRLTFTATYVRGRGRGGGGEVE